MLRRDISELVTGDVPKLSYYTIVRKGEGMPIRRRAGFDYQHMAYRLKGRPVEPFIVRAKYSQQEQDQPIHLSTHKGYEFDMVLRGSLKMQLEDHQEMLYEGDCVMYDSGRGHGMIAAGGQDCEFLAVVIKDREE